jgi:hypothetical protein
LTTTLWQALPIEAACGARELLSGANARFARSPWSILSRANGSCSFLALMFPTKHAFTSSFASLMGNIAQLAKHLCIWIPAEVAMLSTLVRRPRERTILRWALTRRQTKSATLYEPQEAIHDPPIHPLQPGTAKQFGHRVSTVPKESTIRNNQVAQGGKVGHEGAFVTVAKQPHLTDIALPDMLEATAKSPV